LFARTGIWPQFDDQVTHLLVVSADRTQERGFAVFKCLAFQGGERMAAPAARAYTSAGLRKYSSGTAGQHERR
jgi:hypothetical protein